MCVTRWTGLVLALLASRVVAAPIPAIAYHDIVDRRGADEFAVTREEFRRQMAYLRAEGYIPVSLRQLDAARRGETPLPPKAVLLSFDDGLASFASHALPVLREYGYPAVLAVVTAWIDGRATPEHYRGRFLSWTDLRQIAARGDIEIISHSDNLHRGLRANPQGNLAPAVVTREYRSPGRYEPEEEFRKRVGADLARSHERLLAELKRSPMAIAWPYGQYDAVLIDEAERLGMKCHLTLEDEPTDIKGLPRINRATFHRYRRLSDFADMLTWRKWRSQQQRFVELSLDGFAGLAPAGQEQRLSALLARLELLRVNGVVVRPFTADFKQAFFPNPRVPVAADLLNRVLHQIRARVHVDHLYLRIPVLHATDSVGPVYRELARLNRFSGILIDGTVETSDAQALAKLFRHYNPSVKIGVAAGIPKLSDIDLVWSEISAGDADDAIEARAHSILTTNGRALFLLQRPAGLTDDKLVSAMQALRRAGARHYGFSNDEYAQDRPALARIVPELRAHVVAPENGDP